MEKAIMMASITITSIVCLFLTWYFWFKARQQERLLLIEKGIEGQSPVKESNSSLLKLGIVLVGLSIGLLTMHLLHNLGGLNISDSAGLSIMGLSGGISLIVANSAGKTNGK
jgi:hypothetical protein